MVSTAITPPPAGGPPGGYWRVDPPCAAAVMTAVLAALGLLVTGPRWVAAAIRMPITLAASASAISLHHHRISGRSTGYRPGLAGNRKARASPPAREPSTWTRSPAGRTPTPTAGLKTRGRAGDSPCETSRTSLAARPAPATPRPTTTLS